MSYTILPRIDVGDEDNTDVAEVAEIKAGG